MRSITDNITEDKLLEEINEISSLPMYADRKKADERMAQHAKMAQHRRKMMPQ
jgi:mRNA-capping enzyme